MNEPRLVLIERGIETEFTSIEWLTASLAKYWVLESFFVFGVIFWIFATVSVLVRSIFGCRGWGYRVRSSSSRCRSSWRLVVLFIVTFSIIVTIVTGSWLRCRGDLRLLRVLVVGIILRWLLWVLWLLIVWVVLGWLLWVLWLWWILIVWIILRCCGCLGSRIIAAIRHLQRSGISRNQKASIAQTRTWRSIEAKSLELPVPALHSYRPASLWVASGMVRRASLRLPARGVLCALGGNG